jgi:hypothetical protein
MFSAVITCCLKTARPARQNPQNPRKT